MVAIHIPVHLNLLLCGILFDTFTDERLHDFHAGLSNNSPNAVVPALTNYHVCGKYHGAVGAGAWATVHCHMMAARYVIVQIPGDKEVLTLCEVQVSGTCE